MYKHLSDESLFIYLKKKKGVVCSVQTVRGYEWISNCFNWNCSTCSRISAVWKVACKKMGNRPECKNTCLYTLGRTGLCTVIKIYRIFTSVFFHRRSRTCYWTDLSIRIWMGTGSVMADHRWIVLRCRTGFWRTVCIRKE